MTDEAMRVIRAAYTAETVTVYQAYAPQIGGAVADARPTRLPGRRLGARRLGRGGLGVERPQPSRARHASQPLEKSVEQFLWPVDFPCHSGENAPRQENVPR